MTMFLEHSFTDARSHLTAVVDKVVSNQPQIIRKRKQSEKDVMLIDTVTQKELLAGFSFTLDEFQEEDGSITLALDVLALYANGNTEEEALNDLLEQLQVYAEEYLTHINEYRYAPNRKAHLPYVLRIALCENEQELRQMLNA